MASREQEPEGVDERIAQIIDQALLSAGPEFDATQRRDAIDHLATELGISPVVAIMLSDAAGQAERNSRGNDSGQGFDNRLQNPPKPQ